MPDTNIILIDNYDSFSYNLKHQIEQLSNERIHIVKNDQIELAQLINYDHIIISPGPGLPDEAAMVTELIKSYYKKKKILGICLGLQAIVTSLGGSLKQLKTVYHGIEAEIFMSPDKSILFEGLSDPFIAGRYHSWVASDEQLPDCLQVNCWDNEGVIMGIEHKTLPVYGLQFHPESIMSPQGSRIIKNFLDLKY